MMVRFLCVGFVLGVIGAVQPMPLMEDGQLSGDTVTLSLVQKFTVVLFHAAGWTWLGWGVSYWRFRDSSPSNLVFFWFPALSGAPVLSSYFWFVLRQIMEFPEDETAILLALSSVAGSCMALFISLAGRYGPKIVTEMNKRLGL